jgi:TRAP-type C4-dicarboxylate transport system substrate-binding protein
MWDGFWMLANKRSFQALPPDIQQIVQREYNRSAEDERADLAKLDTTVAADLKEKGLEFIEVDKAPFRETLKKTGFYAEWKKKFGDQAWSVLESNVGVLS